MTLRRLEWWDRYQVAGDDDIRGWGVYDDAGHSLGTVADLIFEVRTNRVRYLSVDLGDAKVVMPVGVVDLDEASKRAIARGITERNVRELPRDNGELTIEEPTESIYYRELVGGSSMFGPAAYAHPSFERVPERVRRIEARTAVVPSDEVFFAAEPSAEERRDRH